MASHRELDPSNADRVRPRQVASLLARVLQERLAKGLADPRFRGMVSVTEVDLAPDLRSAVVRVSVLPDKYGPRVLHALGSARGLLRKQIRSETSLRRIPELEFRLDDSIKRDAALAEAIRDHDVEELEPVDREGPDHDSEDMNAPSGDANDRNVGADESGED